VRSTPRSAAEATVGVPGYVAAFEAPMRLALAEAAACAGASPAGASQGGTRPGGAGQDRADVPVGAVVLDPAGAVVARGRNRREAAGDPTAHAEIEAIRAAALAIGGRRLDGCTIVVTLEPCTMCAGAVVLARLDRVVYGAPDPKGGAAGSLWDLLRDRRLGHTPEVIGGVLEEECGGMLREFFASRRGTER
jgi:tRNA(adenine34) deaminase